MKASTTYEIIREIFNQPVVVFWATNRAPAISSETGEGAVFGWQLQVKTALEEAILRDAIEIHEIEAVCAEGVNADGGYWCRFAVEGDEAVAFFGPIECMEEAVPNGTFLHHLRAVTKRVDLWMREARAFNSPVLEFFKGRINRSYAGMLAN